MFETRPRRIASSAIARWLQWLIGRSLSDGFSQVIAITAQICSGGVCRRCARARRIREPLRHGLGGWRLPPPPPIPHRLRPHVEFSRALADANIVGGMQ